MNSDSKRDLDPAAERARALERAFVQSNANDMAGIQAALEAHDGRTIAQHAHRILGAALVLRERALSDAAQRLEAEVSSETLSWDSVGTRIESLSQAVVAYREKAERSTR